jgi:muramoyltetrapeptide carboxypeptidase
LIGVVAPASPFDSEAFEQGLARLKAMGFGIHLPQRLFEWQGYLAGSDRQRAGMVNALFGDDDIQGIVCARGGFGSMKILPHLDYDLIRMSPKVFVGCSDISALMAVLVQKCRLVCFHGPMVTSLAEKGIGNAEALFSAIGTGEPIMIQAARPLSLRSGRVTAPVVGGNLTTLCHLVGTPFAPDWMGRILLLEDRGEAPYRIDRMLTQMKYAGCFRGLAGLALGSFIDCGSAKEISRIVTELFAGEDFPILAGLDVGHSKANRTVALGLVATLDADAGNLCFAQPATRT